MRHLGASILLAVVLSGLAAYLWLRKVTGERAATITALVYMIAPYHLGIDLYSRLAFAELWAFVWPPLILYFVHLIGSERRSNRFAVAGLAVSYAALITTHLPTTLLFSVIPPLLSYFAAEGGRRLKSTLLTIAAMSLGIGLAAIYLVPALTTQKWVSLFEMQANLYGERWLRFPQFSLDNLDAQLSWAALTTFTLAVCALLPARRSSVDDAAIKYAPRFWFATACASVLLMTPLSDPVWRLVAPLQSIQFPWRFNVILTLAATALVARALKLSLLLVGCLIVLSWAAFIFQRAAPAMHKGRGALDEGVRQRLEASRDAPEYRPAGAASIQTQPFAELMARICQTGEQKRARVCPVEGTGEFVIEGWQPREIRLRVETTEGVSFNVSQFYYPGWAAYVDERRHPLEPSQPDGLLHVTVTPGVHQVLLRLRHTAAEDRGIIVSSVSVILLILCVIVQGKRLRGKKPARLPTPA